MSQILSEENAIITLVANRMVTLGSYAGQFVAEGKDAEVYYEDGLKILKLLKAYRKKAEMTAGELEALLYCLKKLSAASEFPTTSPIVGQALSISQTTLGTELRLQDLEARITALE